MEEIKVGDFVRLRDGEITRVKAVNGNIFKCKFHKVNCELFIDFIVKHSSNVIDLIEVGDYVNGKLIHNKFGNPKNGELMIIYGNGKHFDNKNIKTIVTKEQFALAEYKVKE